MFILGRNSDLDLEVAEVVFRIDSKIYRWCVPFFSEDRNSAAMVNTEMAFREDETRERYDEELERTAIERGWKSKPEWSGLSMLLSFLLPKEICNAAIMACQSNIDEAALTDIDKDHTLCRETIRNDFFEHRSKTPLCHFRFFVRVDVHATRPIVLCLLMPFFLIFSFFLLTIEPLAKV